MTASPRMQHPVTAVVVAAMLAALVLAVPMDALVGGRNFRTGVARGGFGSPSIGIGWIGKTPSEVWSASETGDATEGDAAEAEVGPNAAGSRSSSPPPPGVVVTNSEPNDASSPPPPGVVVTTSGPIGEGSRRTSSRSSTPPLGAVVTSEPNDDGSRHSGSRRSSPPPPGVVVTSGPKSEGSRRSSSSRSSPPPPGVVVTSSPSPPGVVVTSGPKAEGSRSSPPPPGVEVTSGPKAEGSRSSPPPPGVVVTSGPKAEGSRRSSGRSSPPPPGVVVTSGPKAEGRQRSGRSSQPPPGVVVVTAGPKGERRQRSGRSSQPPPGVVVTSGPKGEGRQRSNSSSQPPPGVVVTSGPNRSSQHPPGVVVTSSPNAEDRQRSGSSSQPPPGVEVTAGPNSSSPPPPGVVVSSGPKAEGRQRSSRSSQPPPGVEVTSGANNSPQPPPGVVVSGGAGPKAVDSRRSNRGEAGSRQRRTSDRRRGPREPRQASASGPRSTGPRSSGPRLEGARSVGPRSAGPRPARRIRTEAGGERTRQRDGPQPQPASYEIESPRTLKPQEPFDGKLFTARQTTNPEAPRLDLRALSTPALSSVFRCVTPGFKLFEKEEQQDLQRPNFPFEYKSLDDLMPSVLLSKGIDPPEDGTLFSLSEKFNSDMAFRNNLRSAIRLDVFETTPFYAKLPEKAKSVLLLPDSSLEGSWRIPDETETHDTNPTDSMNQTGEDPSVRRMKHTTSVLNQALQEHCDGNDKDSAPSTEECHRFRFTGDDLFRAIGDICGDGASTHWIDIYGVQDRMINHSWHLDAGRSPKSCRTVLWGFPPEDNYNGTGVFSHIISLEDPFGSTLDIVDEDVGERPRMEPVLFEGSPGEDFVFRPLYEAGKELLIYRDIDVLHSAPDVAYRSSVMRFM